MHTINAEALAKLSAQYGSEPITIIEIQWGFNWGRLAYADRQVVDTEGKTVPNANILSVSDIDAIVNMSGSSSSQQITVTLDDTDGYLKTLLDTQDIHFRPAWVYQYFDGMLLDSKILLFKGKINTPIIWNEGNRTLTIDIVSSIENSEIGFSAEQGQFTNIPNDLVGQPWPMVFGTGIYSKCLRLDSVCTGFTMDSVAIRDLGLDQRVKSLVEIANHYGYEKQLKDVAAQAEAKLGDSVGFEINDSFSKIFEVYKMKLLNAYAECYAANLSQIATEAMSFRVYGGEKFPSGPIILDVDGALFYGQFITGADGVNDTFQILSGTDAANALLNSASVSRDTSKDTPVIFQGVTIHNSAIARTEPDPKLVTYLAARAALPEVFVKDKYRLLPYTEGGYWYNSGSTAVPYYTYVTCPYGYKPDDWCSAVGSENIWKNWNKLWSPNGNIRGEDTGYFFKTPGAKVSVSSAEPQRFIASITPGVVNKVYCFSNYAGKRFLVELPKEKWTTEVVYFGSIAATVVTLLDDLSKDTTTFAGSEEIIKWESDLYVNFTSTVGPNTVDILSWLVTEFTDLTIDATSAAAVSALIANFPSHFTLTKQGDALSILKEIAWQARCALVMKDDVVYFHYLPKIPTPVDTITESDVDANTLEVSHSSSDDIVTKMTCTWRATGAQEKDNVLILRNNVGVYGLHSQDYSFYIYNNEQLVEHAALFWLIRYSNTWKKVSFTTPIHKIGLETFDPVTLDFSSDYVSTSAITALVEQANYDSSNQTVKFVCWTPVLAGTMVASQFAWPSAIDDTVDYRSEEDWLYQNEAYGHDAAGILANGPTDNLTVVDYFKLNLVYNLADTGWVRAPSIAPAYGISRWSNQIQKGASTPDQSKTNVNNTTQKDDGTSGKTAGANGADRSITASRSSTSSGTSTDVLDISKVRFYDPTTKNYASLNKLVPSVPATGDVILSTSVLWVGASGPSAAFDFKYDTNGKLFGAGTAFYK